MAIVTLTGKVKFPDGQIPAGALEFVGAQKIEDATGAIKAPLPAQVSLDAAGATSVTLEAGEQYDVTAVIQDPASRTTARTALGRWLAPAVGEFTAPHLFDAWRKGALTGPYTKLLSWLDGRTGLSFTPHRGAESLVTSKAMAYRASGLAAPLGVVVPVQGLGSGAGGDLLSYPRGAQISGRNYEVENGYQGTVAVLLEVPWAGSDPVSRYVLSDAGPSNIVLRKTTGGVLHIDVSCLGTTANLNVNIASWTRASRHSVVVRWCAAHPVSGSNYVDIWVEGVQSTVGTGVTSPFTPSTPGSVLYLGCSATGTNQLGGTGILAKVVTDYVWSAAEIAAFHAAGAFLSPDRVMLHPEGLKLAWLPGARGATGGCTGALTAEACSWDWLPYDAVTHPNGTLAANGRFEAALGAEWVANGASLGVTTPAAGFFDAGCLEVTSTGGASGYATQTVLAAAGTSAYVSGWLANVDANFARLLVYSGTAGTPLASCVFSGVNAGTTPAKASGCVAVATGHDRLTLRLEVSTASAGKIARFDNVGIWLNRVTNGGMEGTYTKTGSALTTSSAGTTVTDLGGGVYRVVDGSAWNLSLAVVGMIAEWHDGSGFIAAVTDASDLIELSEVTGNPPDSGDAVAIYSAIAPGWSRVGSPRLYRAAGRSGAYAQGVAGADGSNYVGQTISVTSGQWYLVTGWIWGVATATGRLGANNLLTTYTPFVGSGGTFALTTAVGRATGAAALVFAIGQSTAVSFVVDDVAVLPLSSVTLTATPASDTASQDADGYRLDGADQAALPGTDRIRAGAGTVALAVKPRGWDGTTTRAKTLLDTTPVSNSRLTLEVNASAQLALKITDAAGAIKEKRLAVDGTTLPADTVAVVFGTWSAGTLGVRLHATDGAVDSGAGTGILGAVPTPIMHGADKDGANQGDVELIACLTFEGALTPAEMATVRADLLALA